MWPLFWFVDTRYHWYLYCLHIRNNTMEVCEVNSAQSRIFCRTKFRVEMNEADNISGSKAVDSFINYETVKVVKS